MIAGLKLSPGKPFAAQDFGECRKYGSIPCRDVSRLRMRQSEVSPEIYQKPGDGTKSSEKPFRGIFSI